MGVRKTPQDIQILNKPVMTMNAAGRGNCKGAQRTNREREKERERGRLTPNICTEVETSVMATSVDSSLTPRKYAM